MANKRLTGASLFSSAGIAETYFNKVGIDIKVASELIPKRAQLYEYLHPKTKMIQGDITKPEVFEQVSDAIKRVNPDFLIATPPCQGMSSLGKKDYSDDERNYLVFYVLKIIKENDFKFIFIENVPKFLKLYFPYKGKILKLVDILSQEFGDKYEIEAQTLNAADFGVPQSRPRAIIKMWKKEYIWPDPDEQQRISLKQAIGDLPSLESGQDSGIKWHYAKNHNEREILAMKHTPEGKSALKNAVFYPKKENGMPIKGFHNTYKRMKWDEPAPARAMNNGNMGGHNNVHPGRKKSDGTYSDARVLTLRELFIVSSLPADMDLPEWCSDNLIRQTIGEAIPPKFSEEIVKGIFKNDFRNK